MAKKKKRKSKAKDARCSNCKHGRAIHAGREGCAHLKGGTFCPCPGFRA